MTRCWAALRFLAAETDHLLDGPFPLIVLGQGWSIEPAISLAALGEYLAGRGFVVATAPLVGTNSPVARVDAQDLDTEVRDLEFVIASSRESSFVSQDKLGVIGTDMLGMAGATTDHGQPGRRCIRVPGLGHSVRESPSGLPRSAPAAIIRWRCACRGFTSRRRGQQHRRLGLTRHRSSRRRRTPSATCS